MTDKILHNIYIGSETGVLKGVHIPTDGSDVQTRNFHNLSSLEKENEVCCMAWGDEEQRQVLLGLRCQAVKVYDTVQGAFTMCRELKSGTGPIVGLGTCQGAVVTAVQSGTVKLWKFDESERVTIEALDTGEELCRMRQSASQPELVATGGRENDLQVWDLTRPAKPFFKAKNVRNDMLDLRVPVWVSDMTFMEDARRIASCHRHSFIRLYDTLSGQRRPVISASAGEEPLICMSRTSREHQVVVGSARGRLDVYDLRTGRLVHSLKGMAGSVREVLCHPTRPYVASVSLDRFLRIHNVETKKLVHKVYLKSRLNCLLMRRNFALDPAEIEDEDQVAEAQDEDFLETSAPPVPDEEEEEDDIQIVEEFLDDGLPVEEPKKEKKKRKRKLPKLKVSDKLAEEMSAPRKQKLPKLVTMSKKKKKRPRPAT